MVGQTNLFDDVIKKEERFVIVVQALEEKNGKLLKRTLREYPSLEHTQMNDLFSHLKKYFLKNLLGSINQHIALLFIQT